jgi:hypothetical protein
MSSPKTKAPAAKKAAKKAAPAPAGAVLAEPSRSDKAAFLKAMAEGIKPGTKAATKSAAKRFAPGETPPASPKPAPKKSAKPAQPKVEVLRKISGNAPAPAVPATPETQRALALAKEIEAALADGKLDAIQPQAMQALMGALCKVYAAQDELGERYPILSGRAAVTGTDVMIVCGSLLRSVDLQVFELGMWQSWSGR